MFLLTTIRPLFLAALFATSCLATDISVELLSFAPCSRLTIEPQPGSTLHIVAGRRQVKLMPHQTAGLRAEGVEVDLFAQRAGSTATLVTVEGAMILRDGVRRRRYNGRLSVAALGGKLSPVLSVSLDEAVSMSLPPNASQQSAPDARARIEATPPQHGRAHFCDMAHCGLNFESRHP